MQDALPAGAADERTSPEEQTSSHAGKAENKDAHSIGRQSNPDARHPGGSPGGPNNCTGGDEGDTKMLHESSANCRPAPVRRECPSLRGRVSVGATEHQRSASGRGRWLDPQNCRERSRPSMEIAKLRTRSFDIWTRSLTVTKDRLSAVNRYAGRTRILIRAGVAGVAALPMSSACRHARNPRPSWPEGLRPRPDHRRRFRQRRG